MKAPHSCAFERNGQQGESPCPASSGGPVTEGNCVLMRGGGEQPKVNSQSVAYANSIRPATLASLRVTGEAPMVSARFGPFPDFLNREGRRWLETEWEEDPLL